MRWIRCSAVAVMAGTISALSLGVGGLKAASALRCEPVVQRQLERLGVPEADVAGETYAPRYKIFRSGQSVIGIDAWVGLKPCRGSLVLKMTPDCRFEEAYTTGACELDGVPSY